MLFFFLTSYYFWLCTHRYVHCHTPSWQWFTALESFKKYFEIGPPTVQRCQKSWNIKVYYSTLTTCWRTSRINADMLWIQTFSRSFFFIPCTHSHMFAFLCPFSVVLPKLLHFTFLPKNKYYLMTFRCMISLKKTPVCAIIHLWASSLKKLYYLCKLENPTNYVGVRRHES